MHDPSSTTCLHGNHLKSVSSRLIQAKPNPKRAWPWMTFLQQRYRNIWMIENFESYMLLLECHFAKSCIVYWSIHHIRFIQVLVSRIWWWSYVIGRSQKVREGAHQAIWYQQVSYSFYYFSHGWTYCLWRQDWKSRSCWAHGSICTSC